MFKKPFHIKTNVAMKGSDKRKLRSSVLQQFAEMTTDHVDDLLPGKAQTTCMKVQTHAGDHLLVYCVDGVPMFFENEKVLYPTVYTLWRYPALLPCLTTWPPVVEKLKGGADLMLPGVSVPPEGIPQLERAQMCGVNVLGNLAPVAMGTAAMSSADMIDRAMKGKGLLILHAFGDHLWEAGNKSRPPQINPPSLEETNSSNSQTAEAIAGGKLNSDSDTRTTHNTEDIQNGEIDSDVSGKGDAEGGGSIEDDVAAMVIGDSEATGGGEGDEVGVEDDGEEDISPTEAMDQLLYQCLLHSLKRKVKPSDLPLLTSTFYRNFVQPCCPEGRTLDMKKSSYKKLSKFLSAMQELGLLEVKQVSHGVDSVMVTHRDHPEIRSFVPPEDSSVSEDPSAAAAAQPSASTRAPDGPPEITTFYGVLQNQVPVFQESGFQRGAWLTKEDVRNAVTAYVKKEGLVDQQDFGRVMLDPLLHDAIINRSEGSVEHLKWDQLFTRFLHKMSPGYQIVFPGVQASAQAPIHKGKVQPVKLSVKRKAGNKWITIIENLEQFSIDPRDFAHRLQIAVAASTTITEGPGKSQLVTVQGNQLKFLDRFLTGHYKMHRRYIEGLQQQTTKPKPKGKR